ncbi:hypothetical protein B0I35DRAFT_477756 [Stachybotrys elegans]|uniref:DUF7492 domain-containing protein n=1 Tax=Stachybotrys elegans TaxID=80388 RepID=A0A8K0SUL0_9HYPO|nr:hypothetical protein B0I35DRAFT_477756 [Stachybotrys elegans]
MRTLSSTAAALLALVGSASAHSWVEKAQRVHSNGTMIGPEGHPRGFIARDAPGFNDGVFVNIMPYTGQAAYSGNELLNKYKFDPNPQVPFLEAAPGDKIALTHLENGHTTIPSAQPNKPRNRGTVFIYGTSSPNEEEKLFDVHLKWNRDGTGGDGRGRLLSTRNYDDGQCYQPNGNPMMLERVAKLATQGANPLMELECQSIITLPDDLEPDSIYTIYWYWDWPDLNPEAIDIEATTNGIFPWAGSFMRGEKDPSGFSMDAIAKNESYSSVLDIKILPASAAKLFNTKGEVTTSFIKNQNVYHQAIYDQLQNNFDVPASGGQPGGQPGGSPAEPSAPVEPNPPPSSPSPPVASPPVANPPVEDPASGDGGVVTVTVTATVAPTTLVTTVYRTVPAPEPTTTSESTSTVVVTVTARIPEPSTVIVTQTTHIPPGTVGAPGGANESQVQTSLSTPVGTPVPTAGAPVFMRFKRSNWALGAH